MPKSKEGWVYVRKKKVLGGPGWWPESKKTEALLTYLATGSMTQTSAIVKVPKDTIYKWTSTEWWKNAKQQILDEENTELSAKYTKIIKKALSVAEDRLENGNFQYDQKTGEIIRVQVSLNDVNNTLRTMADQRTLLNKSQVQQVERQETVNEKLVKLASQFAEMALKKPQAEKVVGEVYEGDWEEAKPASPCVSHDSCTEQCQTESTP